MSGSQVTPQYTVGVVNASVDLQCFVYVFWQRERRGRGGLRGGGWRGEGGIR